MIPAAWLSTINPADAARKKTSHSCQNTSRRRSAAAGTSAPAGRGERHAGSRDQPRAEHAGGADHGGERPERGADAEGADAPAEERRREHRAGREEADDVAVHEAVASSHGQVDDLLHEDVARAAAGAEEYAVPEGQLGQAAGARGERDAQGTRGGAGGDQDRWRRQAIDVGRHVHPDAEAGGGEPEDEREVGAAQPEQGLQRLQEHAERVERAHGQVERGGRRDHAPRARPDAGVAHAEEV